MSVVGGICYRYFRKRRFGYGMSCLAGVSVLLGYSAMIGPGSSVFRALIMFFIYLFSEYEGTAYDLVSSISLAGIWMYVEHPWRIAEGGCMISFLSVLSVGLVNPVLQHLHETKRENKSAGEILEKGWKERLKESTLTSLAIALVTAPVNMRLYYEFSPLSILLNLLVIPLMTPLMISAVAGGICGIWMYTAAAVICIPARVILLLFYDIFCFLRHIPGTLIITGIPTVPQMMVMYLLECAAIVCWYFSSRRMWTGLFFILFLLPAGLIPPGFLHRLQRIPGLGTLYQESVMEVCMLDVGQGDSIMICLPEGRVMLIDGGSTSRKNVGRNIIKQALKYYGYSSIDCMVMTHADEDHVNGLTQLCTLQFPVKQLIVPKIQKKDEAYQNLVRLAEKDGANIAVIERGGELRAGSVRFQCLHPGRNYRADDRNGYSTVLLMSYVHFQMMFTGDISSEEEEEIINYCKKKGIGFTDNSLSVLKVAHHGSKYSSGASFLEYTRPKYAIISAGRNNRYGHPHKDTLQRMKPAVKGIYVTAYHSAIIIRTNGEKYELGYFYRR